MSTADASAPRATTSRGKEKRASAASRGVRTVTNTTLEVMPLPFPIVGYQVTEAHYSETVGDASPDAAPNTDDITVGHQLQLSEAGGAVRLSVTAVGHRGAVELKATIAVLLAFGRPAEYPESDLLKVLSTAGVNMAFSLLRAELLMLTRSGSFGPVHLDPTLLVIKPVEDKSADVPEVASKE